MDLPFDAWYLSIVMQTFTRGYPGIPLADSLVSQTVASCPDPHGLMHQRASLAVFQGC